MEIIHKCFSWFTGQGVVRWAGNPACENDEGFHHDILQGLLDL